MEGFFPSTQNVQIMNSCTPDARYYHVGKDKAQGDGNLLVKGYNFCRYRCSLRVQSSTKTLKVAIKITLLKLKL